MATSYNKLWKLLVDKKMSKADLRKASGVSPNTMTKLRRDEPVMLSVLDKICKTLDVNYGDIVDYVPDGDTGESVTMQGRSSSTLQTKGDFSGGD